MRGRALWLAVLLSALSAPSLHARKLPFPKAFLWGTAIAGFQSDMGLGAPNDEGTDWWVWVRDPANVAAGRVSGDLPETGPGFWNLYRRDAKLVRGQLAGNAFRMGIEWSRIFPVSTAGVDTSGGITPAVLAELDMLADPSAVAHYRDVFAALKKRHLRALVTLNHLLTRFARRDGCVPLRPPEGVSRAWPPQMPELAAFHPSSFTAWAAQRATRRAEGGPRASRR